jgi:hypothetical protein
VQYVKHWNKKSATFNFIKYIQALPFYWTSPSSSINNISENIVRVVVVESTTFYSALTGFKEIRNQEIHQLQIPNGSSKLSQY